MSKKIGWVSAAIMAAACSGGGGDGDTTAPAPGDIGTPPPTTPPAQNMPPVVGSTDLRAQLDGGSISVPINVSDPDGDPVELVLIDAPDWVSLNQDGQLTGTPEADQTGSFDISIEASDGTNTSQITLTLTLFMDPVEQALVTGDYTYITRDSDTDVPTVLLNEIEATRERNKAALREIYRLNEDGTLGEDSLSAVSWDPSNDYNTYRFTPVFGQNFPLTTTNTSHIYSLQNRKYHFALAGFYGDTRYAVISGNPVGDTFVEDSHRHHLVKNTIEWMIEKDPTDLNILMAQSYEGSEFVEMRSWLEEAFPDQVRINEPRVCDGIGFATCMESDPDLLVLYQDVSSEQEADILLSQITDALDAGTPLLFVRNPQDASPLGNGLRDLLNFSHDGVNVSGSAHLTDASPLDFVYGWEPSFVDSVERLVNGIEAGSFNYDVSECVGPVQCEENEAFLADVGRPVSSLKTQVAFIDERPMDPFLNTNPNRFYAALLLAGDYYRSSTTFPMPKATTPSNDIARALFGENTAAIYRKHNPAMPDMGSYSRSAFSDGLLENVAVSIIAAPTFRTSGVYAIPGETVSVSYTRSDDLSLPVWIQVNSLSDASGDPFRTVDGLEYERPTRVSSNQVQLNVGETVEFTSAYGGPIHVYFHQNDSAPVDLAFQNVAKHPVWTRPEDTESFLIDLAADEFDWAEFVRPNFELHSTVENMQALMANPNFSDASDIAETIDTYLRGWQIWLDGKLGTGVPENPDLLAFHQERRLEAPPITTGVIHMNSERATCDETCSGNPYDSFEPFDPLSLAHQSTAADLLVREELRFNGAQSGAINDLYAAHSFFRRYQATGETVDECPVLPYEDLYVTLQAAAASGDAQASIANSDLRAPEQQNALFIQMMTALQAQGALEDGWLLLPRHNLMMYEDSLTIAPNYFWPGYLETAMCFDGLLQVQARSLNNSEWLLVTLSCAARRDLTPYLQAWGYEFGELAISQMTKLSLPELEPVFYAIPPTGHCTGLDHPELPIDGVTTWPN